MVGACFAVRRDAFEAAHGFDESFWLYGEEADLCARIAELGWTIATVDDAVARHVGGTSGNATPDLAALSGEHFERGGEHFVAKHGGPRALVSYRLANLTGSALRGALGLGALASEHRTRARRLFRELRHSPRTVAFDSPATRATGKGLVVCSLEAWDEVWRRNQFLVRELLEADPDLRVLFVEPPFDGHNERRRASGRHHARGLRPVPEEGRAFRFEPVKWLPRRLGPWADRWRDLQIRHAVAALGFESPRLWVNDPSYATLADTVPWPTVYDITDDWTQVGGARAAGRVARQRGPAVRALRGGGGLLARPRRHAASQRPDAVLIPNAVDAPLLRAPHPRPQDLPEGPIVLYVGTLHTDRLDVSLVARLAAELDEGTVVLVGPDVLDSSSRQVLCDAGVVLLGARPYMAIPGYLQHADVLIVPHVETAFTESLDPIKLYECLAVGTPTVATPVAGFRGQGPPIHVAAPDAFVDAVRELLRQHPQPCPRTVASWRERATAFADALDHAVQQADAARPRLRVTYFDHCAQLSGGEIALTHLVPAIDGVNSTVILGQRGPLEEVLERLGIPTEIMPIDADLNGMSKDHVGIHAVSLTTTVALLHSVFELRARLRHTQPDLLYANSLKSGVIGSIAGRLAGVPVVWHVRDRITPDYLPRPAVHLIRLLLRYLPCMVIANSETTRATLVGVHDVTVIASPVNGEVGSTHSRAARGVDAPLRIVMIGRLTPWKGQPVFLKAFARAFAGAAVEAIIVGGPLFGEEAYEHELRQLADDLGISGQVAFVGHVDDVPALLASADIVVHASTLPEPFGQVIVEGMALGRAVVASDAGGPSEIITDGVNGLLFPPGDVDGLEHVLCRLASDPALRLELGTAALIRAADYSPERIGAQVLALYRHVAT